MLHNVFALAERKRMTVKQLIETDMTWTEFVYWLAFYGIEAAELNNTGPARYSKVHEAARRMSTHING